MPQHDKRLYPLTSYSIGIWRSPEKTKAYLLVLDQAEATSSRSRRLKTEEKRFVVLVTREAETRGRRSEPTLSVNWLLGLMRQQISSRLRHKNPFVNHTQDPDEDTSVLTFEVIWSNIVGMDFKWPLTEDPRLVFEAAVMTKRVFNSLEEVCLYYQAQPKASNSPDMWQRSLAAADGQQQQQQLPMNKHHAVVLACELGQRHQQQEHNMSRVSSWDSVASGRSEIRPSLDQPSALAAAAGTPASSREAAVRATPTSLLNVQHNPADALQESQHAGMQVTPSAQQQLCSLEQAWAAATGCKPHQQHGRSCSCSSISGVPGSLSTAPTLSAGIAGMATCTALDADTSLAAGAAGSNDSGAAWEGFGECCTPPMQQQQQLGQAEDVVHIKGLRIYTSCSSPASAGNRPESACSGDGRSVHQGLDVEPAAAGAPAAFSSGFSPALCTPLTADPFRQLLEGPGTGYASAPCSMPNSPKVGLGGRTGSGYVSAALGSQDDQHQQGQSLQDIQQPWQGLFMQQQHHQQQRSRYTSGGSRCRSSSSRMRASACPLCQQPLLQRSLAGSLEQLLQHAKADYRSSSHSNHKPSPEVGLLQHKPQMFPGHDTSCSMKIPTAAASGRLPKQEGKECFNSSCSAANPAVASSPISSTSSAAGVDLVGRVQVAGDQDGCLDRLAKMVQGLDSAALHAPVTIDSAVAATASEADASSYAPAVTTSPAAATQGAPQAGETPCAACSTKEGDVERVQLPSSGQQESVYKTRTIIMTFKDPTLPHKLRQFVRSDVHLLKLYESGLPGWAIMLPSYGLYYRPVLRRVTWLLFVLLSVVSMAMGFYDLYKNVPYFKQVMVATFRPAAAVFEWLEGHTQIRLSILLTYMLGRTQLLVQLIKFLTQTSLQPLIGPVTTALAPVISAASATAAMLAWLVQPLITALQTLAGPISVLARLLWLLLQLVWQLLLLLLWSGPLQLLQAVAGGFMGLLQVLLLPVQVLLPTAASMRAGWSAAKGAGQVARTAVPVVKSSAAAASSSWPMLAWYPLEALELMRVSTMRIMRALQAVVKFMVTLGSAINQHRLSLMLQVRQQLRGGLRAAADSAAGRVASAVAVKMGQEHRVQRLHQRLRQTDSLVSMGSELLGHADSVAVGTTLSIDAELSASMSMNGALSVYSAKHRNNNMAAVAKAGEDSDDEVTSALGQAVDASLAQLHWSGAGLRHRSGLGPSREGHHISAGAGSSGKQVSFAMIGSEYVDGVAAMAASPGQLPAAALRRSVDAAMAGNSFRFSSLAGADGYCSSKVGSEQSDLPPAAGVGSSNCSESLLGHSRVVQSLHHEPHKHAGPKASASSPAKGWPRLPPSSGFGPYGGNSSGERHYGTAAVSAVAPPVGLAVNLARRNSWG